MTKRMLIDSSHAEQTRVVIMEDNTLLEYDSELSNQRTLKGNIYLAKITRVEPSLQAAFVDYGGNRHGFLPFSEIHPDYYRIPVADREALLAEQARSRTADEFDDDDDVIDTGSAFDDDEDSDADVDASDDTTNGGDADTDDEPSSNGAALANDDADPTAYADSEDDEEEADSAEADDTDTTEGQPRQRRNGRGRSNGRGRRSEGREEQDRRRSSRLRRSYTIQEVIKRGQIMLIQVVKEERGTKGAAVTSYLSLAGRYCVLMPNTARGGGISRKITVVSDRKRLKSIVESLDIPGGMAVIVRTAGIGRTKPDIKRDFDYLAKTWEQIREVTLQSRAPALIYEESQLIKRVLRDTYSREIEEVLVQGEAAYREAKDFMKTLMPSHAKRVQPYRDSSPPLFHRFQVDAQLEHLNSPIVQLPSGGYLVINLTEALVAIDVNSGRATRERHIEETALKTNMEAAEEIGRQLRLRDLAGLIVIDFIDMEDRRNNASVERKLKDSMRNDRARVHTGRISSLGLLELSRQRLRPSLLETMMQQCPHCEGMGRIHSTGTSALHVLRTLEDHGLRGNAGTARVTVAPDVAFYILNDKRDELSRFERDYGLACRFEPDPTLIAPDMRVEMLERTEAPNFVIAPLPPPAPVDDADEYEDYGDEEEAVAAKPDPTDAPRRRAEPQVAEAADGGDDSNRRRGRRGGRRRREGDTAPVEANDPIAPTPPAAVEPDEPAEADTANGDGSRGRGRRRRRRRSRPETKNLPGVAVFARAATPFAFHVALEPGDSGQDSVDDASDNTDLPEAEPASVIAPTAPNAPATDAPSPAQPDAEPMVAVSDVSAPTAEEPAMPAVAEVDLPVSEPVAAAPADAEPEAAELPKAESEAVIVAPTEVVEAVNPSPAPDSEAAPDLVAEEPPSPTPEPDPVVVAAPEPEPQSAPAAAPPAEPAPVEQPAPVTVDAAPTGPKPSRRRGWWQRLIE